MDTIQDASPHRQLAIVERYERFINYMYPILQSAPRKHGIVRAKRAVQAMRRQNRLDDLRRFAASWGGHAMWADAHRLLLTGSYSPLA